MLKTESMTVKAPRPVNFDAFLLAMWLMYCPLRGNTNANQTEATGLERSAHAQKRTGFVSRRILW